MTHPYYPSGNPRLNHVAMSLDPGLLDAGHRADLCDFWGQVFGFEELEVMTEDRHRLVLSCVHWDQFLFLIADDDPMRCPRLDHFGFSVGTLEELEGVRTGPWPTGSTTSGSIWWISPSTTRGWSVSTRSTSGSSCR
jgi:hypothetical protein